MEDKNELSDIILEKDSSAVLKTKRVLIIVAVLILLFLIVLVGMKLINKEPAQNVQKRDLTLPPEPKNVVVKDKKDDELFKQVPIIEEKNGKDKENFEEMVKSLKEKEIKKEKIIDKDVKQEVKKEVEQEVKKVVKKEVEPVVKESVRRVKKAVTPKVKNSATTKSGAQKGVYIQVGATSRLSPDKKYLNKIKRAGYDYALLPIVVNGKKVTKILVGPFNSTKDAKNHISKVKKEINKDAFIYRVK